MRTAFLVCAFLLVTTPVGHAQGLDAPALRPFADGRNWMLLEDMTYRVAGASRAIVIPRGFVTDFASIPAALRSFQSPLDRHLLAAIVHDFLYWEQPCTRDEADNVFQRAMSEMEVSWTVGLLMFKAVRRFGDKAWNANASERAKGLPRIVPERVVRPPGPLESWPDYREYLRDAGVEPKPTPGPVPSLCTP